VIPVPSSGIHLELGAACRAGVSVSAVLGNFS